METNHAFISYEADLKTQRGEIADLKRKLKEATSLAENEKDTAAKAQDKLDKLRKKLNGKGAEIVELKEELEVARQSRGEVEKEIKERLFDKVHERCELVKSLLTQFRYGPALQANFYGQTKNNLDLVRSLLSKNPPDLRDEKAELKKDMKEYWKAPKEYERAFNRLIRVLSFEGGEFGEDEAEPVEEGEEEEYKDSSEDEEGTKGEDDQEIDEQNKVQEVEHQIVDDPEAEGQVVVDSEDQIPLEASPSKARSPGVATHEEDPANLDIMPPSD